MLPIEKTDKKLKTGYPFKEIFISFLTLFLFVSMLATFYLSEHPQDIRKQAAGTGVTLSMTPFTINVVPGSNFDIAATINTGDDSVSAASLEINYDNTRLELKDISTTSASFLPVVLSPAQISTGSVKMTLGSNLAEPKKGTGILTTLTFKALVESTTIISFGSNTAVTAVGKTANALTSSTEGNVIIANPTPTPSGLGVNFSAPRVSLTADGFYILADGKKYLGKTGDLKLNSDYGDNGNFTTLEAIWTENDVEMRLFMYFYKDDKTWWLSEARTYNGQKYGDWIYYNQNSLTKLVEDTGEKSLITLDLISDPGQKYQGKIHFENIKLQPFITSTPSTIPATPIIMCTPPPCKSNEVYYCPGTCPNGCGTICVTGTPTPTPATRASLSCTPYSGTYNVESTVTVDLVLDTRGYPAFGADIRVSYNASQLEYIGTEAFGLTNVTKWSNPTNGYVDQIKGQIILDYGNNQPAFTGQASIGQVSFRVKSPGQILFPFTFKQQYDNTSSDVSKVWGSRDGVNKINNLTDVTNCVYTVNQNDGVSPTPALSPTPSPTLSPNQPRLANIQLSNGQVNRPYKDMVRAYDNKDRILSLDFTGLPAELSPRVCYSYLLDQYMILDCLLMGTPATPATYIVKVDATNNLSVGLFRQFDLIITP